VSDLFFRDPWWVVTIKAVLALVILLVLTLFTIWFERRVVAFMQQRQGPNMNGPFGLLQSLADGMKLMFKEDFTPTGGRPGGVHARPVRGGHPGDHGVRGDPDRRRGAGPVHRPDHPAAGHRPAGVGAVHRGHRLDRCVRDRAGRLVVRFDVRAARAPALQRPGDQLRGRHGSGPGRGLLYAESLSTSEIVAAQAEPTQLGIPLWYAVQLIPSFIIYLISMVGETNRAPFDLPEAEGELVGGFHTEYSSMRFAMFFMAEYMNMITVSALAVTLFLGGWHAPFPFNLIPGADSGYWGVLWFLVKVWSCCSSSSGCAARCRGCATTSSCASAGSG
jgi:NADH-quinone oxidoreductase subunit H